MHRKKESAMTREESRIAKTTGGAGESPRPIKWEAGGESIEYRG